MIVNVTYKAYCPSHETHTELIFKRVQSTKKLRSVAKSGTELPCSLCGLKHKTTIYYERLLP